MKLYTAPTFASQISASLGTSFAMYSFTGAVPESIDDVDFDFNDIPTLSNKASSITRVKSDNYEGSVRFLNVLTYKRPFGNYFNRIVNKTQLMPKEITLSESQLDGVTVEEFATLFSTESFVNFNDKLFEGDYADYDFGAEVTLEELHVSHHPSSSYRIEDYELLREVEGEWVLCEAFSLDINSIQSGKARVVLAEGYTAQKFRILNKETSSTYRYSAGIEFFTDTARVEAIVPEDITWFMLRSVEMDKDFGSEWPIIVGNAGGPNSGKEVAFSHYDTESGAEIKLMNFKLKSKVIGEANA